MSDKAYTSVKDACAILEALSGAIPAGLPNKEVAAKSGCTPSQVTRLAEALAGVGWVKKLPTGHYCITAQFGRMTFRVMAAFDAAERQLSDLKRNYTTPN